MPEEVHVNFYKPEGVIDFLGLGTDSFIGTVNETTILKYPKTPKDEAALMILDLEAQILTKIGPNKHIIGFKGQREDGILLERAGRGSIAQFLKESTSDSQRFAWACQATNAIAVTHRAGVLHCDINVNNMLLDDDLTVKLCDFQGRLLRADGSIDRDGLARENVKSFKPRADPNYSDRKTDLFALGSAFYHIMQGHEPFPDMSPFEDEEEIEERFASHQFPKMDSSLMNGITHKCWAGEYDSAEAVLQDLEFDGICPVGSCKGGSNTLENTISNPASSILRPSISLDGRNSSSENGGGDGFRYFEDNTFLESDESGCGSKDYTDGETNNEDQVDDESKVIDDWVLVLVHGT